MQQENATIVAVIGTSVIGRSWAYLFANAGCTTLLYDRDPAQVAVAVDWIESTVDRRVATGELQRDGADHLLGRLWPADSLADAVGAASFVQENVPEDLEIKRRLYAEMDAAAPAGTILASSTSALDMTAIAEGLSIAGAARCIVAHPVNPPHVIPVVEVLPGERTSADVVERTCRFLEQVGQKPVRMNRYVVGFLLNRMQAALVREAIGLVASGVADVEAVDTVIHSGLGLRWALMGPFGTANTNADGGVRDYFERYGAAAYVPIMEDLSPTPAFEPELIERIGAGTDAMSRSISLAAQRERRDELIMRIRALKDEADAITGERD